MGSIVSTSSILSSVKENHAWVYKEQAVKLWEGLIYLHARPHLTIFIFKYHRRPTPSNLFRCFKYQSIYQYIRWDIGFWAKPRRYSSLHLDIWFFLFPDIICRTMIYWLTYWTTTRLILSLFIIAIRFLLPVSHHVIYFLS